MCCRFPGGTVNRSPPRPPTLIDDDGARRFCSARQGLPPGILRALLIKRLVPFIATFFSPGRATAKRHSDCSITKYTIFLFSSAIFSLPPYPRERLERSHRNNKRPIRADPIDSYFAFVSCDCHNKSAVNKRPRLLSRNSLLGS